LYLSPHLRAQTIPIAIPLCGGVLSIVALSMRWLVDYARNRGEKSMRQRLAGEIMDASQGKGNAVKKREDVHRMAEANKAFSHFRF
jgi:small subunit ribosomal protein S7